MTIDYDKIRKRIGGFDKASKAEIDTYLSRVPADQRDEIIKQCSGSTVVKKKESTNAVSANP